MVTKHRASLLETGKGIATCPICTFMINEPTSGCPEGHACCRDCYATWLATTKTCPTCRHPTGPGQLVRCRTAEEFMGQLVTRCKHGPDESAGEGGAAPRAKRAKLEPVESMSYKDLRTALKELNLSNKGKTPELAARLEEHRRSEADGEEAHACSWRGKVCDVAEHLAESCGFEDVDCPNAAAGCKASVLRKDAAVHASETCEYRQSACGHCRSVIMARLLPEHEGRCPSAQIQCPNAGCGVTVARGSMAEHRGGCGWEEVECPFPGCHERMARGDVEGHEEASGAVHLTRACSYAVEMELKGADQADTIERQRGVIAGQTGELKAQEGTIFDQNVKIFDLKGTVARLEEDFAEKIGKQREEIVALKGEVDREHNDNVMLISKAAEQKSAITAMTLKAAQEQQERADERRAARGESSVLQRTIVGLEQKAAAAQAASTQPKTQPKAPPAQPASAQASVFPERNLNTAGLEQKAACTQPKTAPAQPGAPGVFTGREINPAMLNRIPDVSGAVGNSAVAEIFEKIGSRDHDVSKQGFSLLFQYTNANPAFDLPAYMAGRSPQFQEHVLKNLAKAAAREGSAPVTLEESTLLNALEANKSRLGGLQR